MDNFQFYSPTEFIFGRDTETKAGEMVKKYGGTKVLIHYGSGSAVKSGLLDRVKASLDESGIAYTELGGVQPNPRDTLIYKGIELCRSEGVDFILSVGGGSCIDSSKAIALGVPYNGDFWDFYGTGKTVEKALPIGTVLTIAAAGSEGSGASVVTKEEGSLKRDVGSDLLRPRFSILNPELTCSLPAYQTACGATDIMAHVFERYFTNTRDVEITDRLCEAVLLTMIKETPRVIAQPDNYEARANIMWCGTLSHNGLMATGNANKGDWACHQIEHELSAEHDVAHGAGLAAIWGSWARYVLSVDPERFVKLGEGVFGESDPVKAIEKFEEFFRSIGMPTDIKGLGLDFDEAACRTAALGVTFQNARKIGNFKVLDTEDIFNIYMMAAGLK